VELSASAVPVAEAPAAGTAPALRRRRPDPAPAARRASRRRGPGWVGLAPFFVVVALVFVVPVAFVLVQAFRVTTTGPAVRDPRTQQFVHTTTTAWSAANVRTSVHGVYATSLLDSVRLSAVVALVAAVLGLVLAQAVVTSRSDALRQVVISAAAVTANFGGIPLAFLFVATVGNAGVVTAYLARRGVSLQDDLHFRLTSTTGIGLVYLYFLVPLMVLVVTPALDGLRPAWGEAAQNLGATRGQYWRWVAGPVLAPSVLGAVLLLFCSSFSAYATAYALVGQSFPLVTTQISAVLSGNVLSGQENLGAALALDMVVLVLPLTIAYQLLQRRTTRWLA
jgi:putative spermidine/putrescine transport system permease protein